MENSELQNIPLVTTRESHIRRFTYVVLIISIISVAIFYVLSYQYKEKIDKIQEQHVNDIAAIKSELSTEKNTVCPQCATTSASNGNYALIGACSGEACLFQGPEAVEGYTKLDGFYTTYTKQGWSGNEVTCDAFRVVNGSGPMFEHFMELITTGNSLNALDSQGNLMIRIDITDLDKQNLEVLKKSSEDSNVTLSFIRRTPEGRSAGDCESVITILDVE